MKTSIIQLKAELKEVQEAHEQINTFFWGDFSTAVRQDVVKYPLMCCFVGATGSQVQRNETLLPLFVIIVDKFYKDESSLDDVESDTLQVCRDIQNTLRKSPRWQKILSVDSATASKIMGETIDEVAGFQMQIQIKLRDSESFCNLPMPDYDFGAQLPSDPDCPAGTAINSDATYSLVVPSGAVEPLPDIDITLNSGAFLTVPSVKDTDVELVNTSDEPIIPVSVVANKITVDTGGSPSGIAYSRPNFGGQTTEHTLYDVGWQLDNGTYDYAPPSFPVSHAQLDHADVAPFVTLLADNIHANKDRFTDDAGGQTYTKAVVEDHLTGLVWTKMPQPGTANWVTAHSNANASTFEGYSDWRIPTPAEYLTIANFQMSTGGLKYLPFNITLATDEFWTNTTLPNNTLEAHTFYYNIAVASLTININREAKTSLRQYFMVRNF